MFQRIAAIFLCSLDLESATYTFDTFAMHYEQSCIYKPAIWVRSKVDAKGELNIQTYVKYLQLNRFTQFLVQGKR